ncbi:MAG: ATP-binding cassette domain-containing protein [Actinomycetota bacterium]|nr:ATP-binding cassette domain-containing protein [Actinomycetota bacterium]
MARFGRKDDDKGSEWVPDQKDKGSEEPFVGYPAEGQYDAERVEEEIYDQRDQGVEVVAEGADEEPRPGSLTEQAAREAEARADAAAEQSGQTVAGNGDPHVAKDGATLGRDFVIPGVDAEDSDPYRWHTGQKREHGGTDAIEIIDLVKQFGRTRILNGLNLGLPDNQISMVLGPSGTGKSVLIKHIVGLLYPDSGDVLVHGESIPNMTDDELFEVRKKFGLLFQDGALFGSMNIYDNVAFPLRQHTDKGEDEISEIVNRRLKEVGLAEAHFHMPNELSGGMRKRAGFARALVLDPAIVMFDEPDSGLDPVRTALLCELIREVHDENGGCYLVISHDLGTARRIADFIAVLWKGQIVESGPKEELFNSENEFVSQFLNAEVTGPLAMD